MAKLNLQIRTEYGTFKAVIFHVLARKVISGFPDDVRAEVGYLLYLLQSGGALTMPHSRPMNEVGPGVSELRVRGKDGIYRVFYFAKSKAGILVFHAFIKKTQATAQQELAIGRKRLRELMEKANE